MGAIGYGEIKARIAARFYRERGAFDGRPRISATILSAIVRTRRVRAQFPSSLILSTHHLDLEIRYRSLNRDRAINASNESLARARCARTIERKRGKGPRRSETQEPNEYPPREAYTW